MARRWCVVSITVFLFVPCFERFVSSWLLSFHHALQDVDELLLRAVEAFQGLGVAADEADEDAQWFTLAHELGVGFVELLFALAGHTAFPDPEHAHETRDAELGCVLHHVSEHG